MHKEQCIRCRKDYDCDGNLERNHDGWPEVICDLYHRYNMQECPDCLVEMEQQHDADMALNVR